MYVRTVLGKSYEGQRQGAYNEEGASKSNVPSMREYEVENAAPCAYALPHEGQSNQTRAALPKRALCLLLRLAFRLIYIVLAQFSCRAPQAENREPGHKMPKGNATKCGESIENAAHAAVTVARHARECYVRRHHQVDNEASRWNESFLPEVRLPHINRRVMKATETPISAKTTIHHQ